VSKYIRIGVSAVLLAFIAWRTDWEIVGEKFATMNVGYWLAAVGVLIFAQVASARRWQLFARELHFERSLVHYCAYYFIGMWFNLSLPTSVGGDVVRVWYLDNQSGRKLVAFASVFLERINGLLVLITFAFVGVLIAPMELPLTIRASVWAVTGGAALGVMSMPLAQRWRWLPLKRREQLHAVVELAKAPRVVAEATVMSILVQLGGVASLWCIDMALGLGVPMAYYCILGPMVSLLTLLPISVNGMGVRELGTIAFLAPLGVNAGAASTLAFLWFMVSVAVSLMGGMVYLFGAYPKAQAVTNEGASDGPVDCNSDQGREGQYSQAA
jgi:uncharacterized membrane protein YbhN (UPF0104 family)